jgi:iron complex outermembrane receptor protein
MNDSMPAAARSRRKQHFWAAVTTLLVGAWAGHVRADEASVPTSGGDQLEEVIVTSQKRSEDILHVPTSISVLNSEALTLQHVVNFDDITRAIPGISVNEGGSPGTSVLSMRGVSSTSGAATVGIYLDEVPITVNNTVYDGNTEPRLFDIDRVEVLRGPQGTLYGASSMGGTIRFISKAPDLNTFSDDVTAGFSFTKHGSVNYEASNVANIPIVQNVLAMRIGISATYDSGYIDNYDFFTGDLNRRGTNDERPLVGRLTFLFKPSDTLTITPAFFIQRDEIGDTSIFYPAVGLYKQNKQITEWARDNVFIPSVTINERLPFANLTSVSSYFSREYIRMTDGTYFNSNIIAYDFLDPAYPEHQAQNDALLANIASPVPYYIHHQQATQELRLSSLDEGPSRVKWVVGLYYSNYWENRNDTGAIPGLQSIFKSIYGFDINQSALGVPGEPNLFANDLVYSEYVDTHEQQYAAFGQVDVDVIGGLRASLGLRYQFGRTTEIFNGGGFWDVGNPNPYFTQTRNYAVTPKYSLTYDIDRDNQVYASVGKGFRLGGPTGPDPVGPGNPCASDYPLFGITNPPGQYKPDTLWSYELGSKSRLLDNTLSVNAAGYYIDWKQIQQTIILPTCGFSFTTNVGDAESYGGELEVLYRALPGLTLGMNGSVNRSVITSTLNAQTAAVGQHILNVPDRTLDLSVDYTRNLPASLLGFIRGDYDLTGKSYGSYQVSNSNYQNPQYAVVNASVGVGYGTYKLSLYCKNLTDNQTLIQQPSLNSVTGGYTVRPRTIGLDFAASF